ncbi:polysaccharide pyruvyl transferase family protein [Vibrio chagasii]|uniref:polysaccharide pyruvyl transferase family protein n=1 Tax=Vibrio chagasii TaxID=170679 RepID=UPI0038CD8C47
MNSFIIGYFNKNVGDELMLKSLMEKNKDRNYFINGCSEEDLVVYRTWHKSVQKITSKIKSIFQCQEIIFIGGSLFQDYSDKAYIYYLKLFVFLFISRLMGKKIHILSSNFGPFKNRLTPVLVKLISKLCTSVIVRDKYSRDFSLCKNTILSKDIVEELHLEKVNKENSIIGVSVIDNKNWDEDRYLINLKCDILKEFNCEDIIRIFAFHSDDTKLCRRLEQMLKEEYKNLKVEIIEYDNLECFLEKLIEVRYMFCSRFHSLILAINIGVPLSVYIYSNKVSNYLNTHYSTSFKGISEEANKVNYLKRESQRSSYVI